VPTLLAAKQKKGKSIKTFVERFWSIALRCPSGVTQSTLVETCRHNLQASILAQMGMMECHTWKQLVLQSEQAEEIIARVRAEKIQQTETGQVNATRTSHLLSREEEILWQRKLNHLQRPSQSEKEWLLTRHVLISHIPLRMSMWSLCSSYSKIVTISNFRRSGALKRWED